MKDLRLAKGTKFQYVVDSYLYACILAGSADDNITAESGQVYLLTGDLAELISQTARNQGVAESALELTHEEQWWLATHLGAVLLEDNFGRCEVEWFRDRDDAQRHFEEFLEATTIQVSSTSLARSLTRHSTGAPTCPPTQ